MKGRESPQQLELIPSYECRLRTTANQTSPSNSSSGEVAVNDCACGPDGLLNCVEQGAHLTLINNAVKA